MTYATLDTSQKTYGVRVPYGHGSYTVHYDNEHEALAAKNANFNKELFMKACGVC